MSWKENWSTIRGSCLSKVDRGILGTHVQKCVCPKCVFWGHGFLLLGPVLGMDFPGVCTWRFLGGSLAVPPARNDATGRSFLCMTYCFWWPLAVPWRFLGGSLAVPWRFLGRPNAGTTWEQLGHGFSQTSPTASPFWVLFRHGFGPGTPISSSCERNLPRYYIRGRH